MSFKIYLIEKGRKVVREHIPFFFAQSLVIVSHFLIKIINSTWAVWTKY